MPTPDDRKKWTELYAEGWSIKDIARKTNFSPDTVSKHLQEKGVKKEEAVKKEPTDIKAELTQFMKQQQLENARKDLKKLVEDGLSKLDFDGTGDFRARLEWTRDRADRARGDEEFRDLSALVTRTIAEAQPLIEEHDEETRRKNAEMDIIMADEEEAERLRVEKQREDEIERAEIRRAERMMSYNTITMVADQMGVQIPEYLKKAYFARSYEDAIYYTQAVSLWFQAGGTPESFYFLLQMDPVFPQRVHANYGCQTY